MLRLGHRYVVAQLLPAAQPRRGFASAAPTSLFTSKMLDRFATMQQRHEELCLQLNKVGGADAAAMVELSELAPVVEALAELDVKDTELTDLNEMLADGETEAELVEMAEEESVRLLQERAELEQNLMVRLVPADPDAQCDVILEVRPGAGGAEAALFGQDMYNMYQRYALAMGWKFEELSTTSTDHGGLKEASAALRGNNVFGQLKYESGVHRVQRVPLTETSGRIHTSTVTIAVLPEPPEVATNFVKLDETELKIDVYRASGAGGQHVNTTESAVRITHIPTGIKVEMQDERSQHKNKAKALRILQARLYEAERQRLHAERADQRSEQVGTGARSERIRTYNFAQDRITDHRVGLSITNMDKMLAGEKYQLGQLVDALAEAERQDLLQEFSEE